MITRARQHLKQLEEASVLQAQPKASKPSKTEATAAQAPIQSDLFATQPHPLLLELQDMQPDELTPRQALDLLYAWKTQI